MIFTGTYEHSIDAKNRLAIPADIRSMLEGQAEDRTNRPVHLYVTLGENDSLCLYTEKGFARRARELDRSPMDTDELLAYERMFFGLARRVEVDKQGRVLLPDTLRSMAKLGAEVVLVGVKDHLEIRDRQQWLAEVQRTLASRPEFLRNPRRMMRASGGNQANPQTPAAGDAPPSQTNAPAGAPDNAADSEA